MSPSLSVYVFLLLLCNICCDPKTLINNGKSGEEYQDKENYHPEELLSKIFGLQNDTQGRQVGGFGSLPNLGPGQHIHFPDEGQDDYNTDPNNQQFENNYQNSQKKPGKRRKKPRYINQYAGQYGYYNYGFDQQSRPGFQEQNGFQMNAVYRPELGTGFGPGNGGGRPASLTASALSSLSKALGSIARNDDYQCVPRLLCEVAAGERPGQSSEGSIFSSLLNMQPLVTLLSAYNGMSSSPLLKFGRAALLGLTSQGNSASCTYAYPQCPRDTDDLINYLNNHNGGFFRYFNGLNQQSNQLGYPQTSNQNNGPLSNLIQNALGISNLTPGQTQNQYGYPQNYLQLPSSQPNPNRYPYFNNINHGQSHYNQLSQNLGSVNSNYGLHNQNVRFRRERKRNLIENNRLEDRIQNYNSNDQGLDKASFTFSSDSIVAEEDKNNLRFPDDTNGDFPRDENTGNYGIPNDHSNFEDNSNIRFPENILNFRESPETIGFNRRRPKKIIFPLDSENGLLDFHDTHQSVFQNGDDGVRFDSSSEFYKNYEQLKAEFIANFESSPSGSVFNQNSESDFNANSGSDFNSDSGADFNNEGLNDGLIYVVRGNGDPNHPEVVRFRS